MAISREQLSFTKKGVPAERAAKVIAKAATASKHVPLHHRIRSGAALVPRVVRPIPRPHTPASPSNPITPMSAVRVLMVGLSEQADRELAHP